MPKIKEYLSNPATWISFCVFLFWLWGIYTSMNMRISTLEEQIAEINVTDIKVTLAEIQKDLQWIKSEMIK